MASRVTVRSATASVKAVAIASPLPALLGGSGGEMMSPGKSYAAFRTASLRHFPTLSSAVAAVQIASLYAALVSNVEEWALERTGSMDSRVWQPLTAAVKQLAFLATLAPSSAASPAAASSAATTPGASASKTPGAIPTDGYPSKRQAKRAKLAQESGVATTPGTG